ncbi:MAG: alpha-glucosidase [Candidatus Nanopelagicales bacterium]
MVWWHETTIYQVYPRSFADSDADGIGDLRGIIEHLDHLVDLGVGTVWVSPFFSSPQEDFGYDVTDYTGVSPEYGTLETAEELIEAAHDRGLHVMFDLVLNHTSDQHPWFLRSKGSRDNPKSDWYLWADGTGRDGRKPPNNWRSALEVNSAWQWSEERGQFYLATFLPFQPDLNWRNPEVKEAMFDAVRFWLGRGVDGFRLDIFGQIMKDPQLRDNPFAPHIATGFPRGWRREYTENTPDNIALARELHAVCAEFSDPDRILLGEVFGSPEVLREYNAEGQGLDLVFLFDFLLYEYDADWFTSTIRRFEESFPAPMQPTYVLENHDRSRSIDRVGGDRAKAAVLAVILLTVRGVPTVYMGQEIGMGNTYLPLDHALDPVAAKYFRWIPEVANKRLGERLNRDEVRTPMQWDGSENAGFTAPGIRPWLPVNPDYPTVNVAVEDDDPDSLLSLYRGMFAVRRELPALHRGSLDLIGGLPPDVLGYRRSDADSGQQCAVFANLGRTPRSVRAVSSETVIATGGATCADGTVTLPPDSAIVVLRVRPGL